MSYVRVWIHSVWGTKARRDTLDKGVRRILFSHIKENAKEKRIHIDTLGGYTDHVHCLFALNADMTIAKALQLMKGEASHWSNLQELVKPELEWADEYYAISVSESQLDRVREYIRDQEEHHRKKSFADECEEFMSKYDFNPDQG